ncbi:MAG TPA: hypothetical protein VN026_18025, partial [Bacteroidia bacterium]|nr:hypothetical protein [Bacteroidia bacterium]
LRCSQFRIGEVYAKTKMYVNCLENYNYQTKSCEFNLPPKTLYNDVIIKVTDELAVFNSFAITPENINFRWPGTIKIKVPEKFRSLTDKLVLARNNSVTVPIKTGPVNEYALKSFGNMRLLLDTVGPKIKTQLPLKKLRSKIKKANHISFVMIDLLSGIDKYNLFINDKWVLAEYDGKTDLLTYWFDAETPLEEIRIELKASDKVGNNSIYKLKLKR